MAMFWDIGVDVSMVPAPVDIMGHVSFTDARLIPAISVGGIAVLSNVAVGFSMAGVAGIAVLAMVGTGWSLLVLAPHETSSVITINQYPKVD